MVTTGYESLATVGLHKPTPSKQALRDQLAADCANEHVTVLPGFVHKPYLESPRRPAPIIRKAVKPNNRRESFGGEVPEGMIRLWDAMQRCGLNSSDNRHIHRFKAVADIDPILQPLKVARGRSLFYFFWPADIEEFKKTPAYTTDIRRGK